MVFIVVTGTPGTGKTVFSEALAGEIGFMHLDVGRFCLDRGLTLGFDDEKQTYIVDMVRLRRAIRSLKDEDVILDGHIAHLIAPSKYVKIAFVLRCHPRVLRRRLEAKGYPPGKVYENVMAEILDSCLIEASEIYKGKLYELDSTDKPVEQLISEALAFYRGEVKPKIGVVDWISELAEEGLLEEYIRGVSE
ncbi:adenylate kinase family protein [Candidatus Bathyarchaeota archaeon]|nr:adenylate kinase family protein [Candidatus Bathyarchaeota archaeon]MBS7617275.1 adenylate kinase family protein [Candidatus Bathyarchaeota archaeon]